MARASEGNEQLLCSFCGKSQRQVKKLIAGPGVYICDECIDLCNEIIDEELTAPSHLDLDNLPRPREIYDLLNDYVVSQEEAKRTLSVAVYNHYKRVQMAAEDDDVELQKSNILLLGPTGCGKTLLAQTLVRILEGTVASVPPQGGRKHPHQEFLSIDTTNILFICGGAFADLEKIIGKRIGKHAVGFGAEIRSSDSIELVFTEEALWEIADKALERETGARGLRSIIEGALLDVMFELPSRKDVSKCVITKETIERGLRPTLVTTGGRAVELDEPEEESA